MLETPYFLIHKDALDMQLEMLNQEAKAVESESAVLL